MNCETFLGTDFVFPSRPDNRPGLDRIAYRIGAYPDFVEFLMREINSSVDLRGWTHREPDDPGIALLQGVGILGDILTFYQERYANEAFLRTARWRESVADLVRLLGYRLAPGVGGRATLAFEVKGATPVDVPAGFPVKADLEEMKDPADFQTEAALTAHPLLSRFRLYRPRSYGTTLPAGALRLEIKSVGGSTLAERVEALGLKPGDRLMLLPAEPSWTSSNATPSTQQPAPQVVKVKAVQRLLGRSIVDLEAGLHQSWTLPVAALRLGRSFRRFGHNAPPTSTASIKDNTGKITGATESATSYETAVMQTNPDPLAVPLDQEVNDLVVQGPVIVQAMITVGGSTRHALSVVKIVTAARATTRTFASLSGPTTLLTLDSALIRRSSPPSFVGDAREYQVHEVTSPPIALQPEAAFAGGAFASGTNALSFYGRLAGAKALAGRRLLLQHADGRLREIRCTNQKTDFVLPGGTVDESRMWTLSFDRAPSPFTRADFDEAAPTVTVFGNVVDATQGKAEPEAPLGNGDARGRFQTFKLPKAPLTYLLSEGATPPQVPDLEIHVNGLRWERVDSFFGRGPLEQVYIVREDAEGTSYVQFGDGETGTRLPSGVKNVVAHYRSGNAAHGPLKKGASPSPGQRIEGLDKIALPGVVGGGATPEAGDKAREAAPGKVQSLGRLVSLRDFETETLTIPGVTTAAAAWGLRDGVPTVTLRVLLDGGRESEFAQVRATIAQYQRCRGPDRFAVVVEQARLRYAFLDLLYAFDPRLVRDDVESRLHAALGLAGDEEHARSGVFGLRRRRLGEKEYATRIAGLMQEVKGISWCRVTALGRFPPTVTAPEQTTLPSAPRSLTPLLACAATELLQLHRNHVTLTAAPPDQQEACA